METDNILRLVQSAKTYSEHRIERFERDSADKMAHLVSMLLVGAIVTVLGSVIVVMLTFAAAQALAPHVGGTIPACIFVALVYAVIIFAIFAFRDRLILAPCRRVIIRNFMGDEAVNSDGPTDADLERERQRLIDDYKIMTAPSARKTRKERFFDNARRIWTVSEGLFLGYKFYRQFRRGRR